MYTFLLSIHSVFRWVVVINIVAVLFYVWYHKRRKSIFTPKDYTLIKITNIVLTVQFIIGISLFMDSVLAKAFWTELPESLSWRQVRFFGLEHPTMMILGVLFSNFFTYKVKSKINTTNGFSYLLKCYFVIVFILITSIPWSFSPFTARPNFRDFSLVIILQ